MSQQLTPINGGIVPQIVTTTAPSRLNVLSPQYIDVKKLQSRPTEWVPGGRPIYRRLPATSETYQVDFFNIASESNIITNNLAVGVQEIGYVYVPWGESINGPVSIEVVASDNNKNLLIKSGVIVWRYGKTQVLPTIANLEVLDVASGQYEVAYQLVYDDAPKPHLYSVSDFSLSGIPLNITSSTDQVIGWRYQPVNAFLNSDVVYWINYDSYFPSYSQPSQAFLQWESELPQSYDKLVLRCSANTVFSGTATLSYYDGTTLVPVETVEISRDSTGQFYEFSPDKPSFQTGWNVSFSDLKVSIQAITVSGVLTLLEPQSAPSPRATLVMYPTGTLPKTVINTQGEEILATYCSLALVDVNNNFTVEKIQDTRNIIHRDYTPVSDWLTFPFDQDLINLYEQVSDYANLWMAPPSLLKQEYANLSTDLVIVEA